MNKVAVFVITLVVILGAAYLIYHRGSKTQTYQRGVKTEVDTAVNQAYYLYSVAKQRGVDFSSGPCLSNAVTSGWVADIAHNPRQPVDDLPENQCSAFREGSAKHFVELDPDGNLIRVH